MSLLVSSVTVLSLLYVGVLRAF